MKKVSLVIIGLVLYFTIGICANADEDQWNSPDGKWSLFIKYTAQNNYYIVRNNITNKSSGRISAYTLPVYVKWAKTDKTIVVVEHISKSSILRELTVENNKWVEKGIGVPADWDSFHVIAINIKKNIATFKCKVVKKAYSFVGVATFNCDLNTGDTTNFKYKDISDLELNAL